MIVLYDVNRGSVGLYFRLLDQDGDVDAQLSKMAHNSPDDGPLEKGRFVHYIQGKRSLCAKAVQQGVPTGNFIGKFKLYNLLV